MKKTNKLEKIIAKYGEPEKQIGNNITGNVHTVRKTAEITTEIICNITFKKMY